MSFKNLILSSSGLKNLVFESNQEEEFQFIFKESTVSMKTTFAEFISPKVSKLHLTDPTIRSISFTDQLGSANISNEVLSKLELLSRGESISINETEHFQIKIISILLENEELFSLVDELFSKDINETNIDEYLSIHQ